VGSASDLNQSSIFSVRATENTSGHIRSARLWNGYDHSFSNVAGVDVRLRTLRRWTFIAHAWILGILWARWDWNWVLVVVGHVAHVFHDADDFIPGRILDLVRPRNACRAGFSFFKEAPGEGFLDHARVQVVACSSSQDDKRESGL